MFIHIIAKIVLIVILTTIIHFSIKPLWKLSIEFTIQLTHGLHILRKEYIVSKTIKYTQPSLQNKDRYMKGGQNDQTNLVKNVYNWYTSAQPLFKVLTVKKQDQK